MKLYVTDPLVMCYISKNFGVKFEKDEHNISYLDNGLITYSSFYSLTNKVVLFDQFIEDLKNCENNKLYVKAESNNIILDARVFDTVFAPITGKYYKIHPSHHRPDIQEIEKEKFGKGAYKNAIIIRRNKVSTLFENVVKETIKC